MERDVRRNTGDALGPVTSFRIAPDALEVPEGVKVRCSNTTEEPCKVGELLESGRALWVRNALLAKRRLNGRQEIALGCAYAYLGGWSDAAAAFERAISAKGTSDDDVARARRNLAAVQDWT